jgi:hypothetical protein
MVSSQHESFIYFLDFFVVVLVLEAVLITGVLEAFEAGNWTLRPPHLLMGFAPLLVVSFSSMKAWGSVGD